MTDNKFIETTISGIVASMGRCTTKYANFMAEKKTIERDFNGNRMLEEMGKCKIDFAGEVNPILTSIKRSIESIERCVNAGNDFDVNDATIHDVANLLKNEGLAPETIENMISKFVGNQVALDILKASAREEYKSYFKNYVYNVSETFKEMYRIIDSIMIEPCYHMLSLSDVRYKLQLFCQKQGIELPMTEEMESLRFMSIASHMGVEL